MQIKKYSLIVSAAGFFAGLSVGILCSKFYWKQQTDIDTLLFYAEIRSNLLALTSIEDIRYQRIALDAYLSLLEKTPNYPCALSEKNKRWLELLR